MLVLDTGAVARLSERSTRALALIGALRDAGLWPPLVPTVVLAECLRGSARDAGVDRLVRTCLLQPDLPLALVRRAAELRRRAGRGSAVDAVVVAVAEPGGTVLTPYPDDLGALASHARHVAVERV